MRSGRISHTRHLVAALAALAVFLATVVAVAAVSRDSEDHRRAVALARDGKLEPAIALLEDVRRRAPGYAPAAHDAVVILGWAGRHADALRMFDSLPAPVPTYVVGSAARSARDLREWDRALTLYRAAAARERGGDATPFIAGEVAVLADANRFDAAIARAETDLSRRRRTLDVMEAAAYAEQRAERPFAALARTEAVLKLDPERRESLRRRVFLLSEIGAPERAREHAEARRALFSAAELRRLDGDVAAALVRRGPLPTATEGERYAVTDKAIAELDALIARWRGDGAAAADDIRRARMDRLIALRDRVRMQEVVAEYEALDGDTLPAYLRNAAAGAYLHLRRPERARDLYRSVLRESPEDTDATIGLIYALVETEEHREAMALADALDAREGIWLWLKGAVEPEPNRRKLDSESLAAAMRLYADNLAEAQARFETMTSAAPNNAKLRAGLAGTYLARGWPRRAAAEADHGLMHDPEDRDLALARGTAALRQRDWRNAEKIQAELGRRFPEFTSVERLQRDWRISRMAELRVTAGISFSDANTRSTGTGSNGGDGYEIVSTLYSPPIAYSWRGFATGRLAQSRTPEGRISLRQAGAGIEWRDDAYEASVQASLAEYGATRAGLRIALGWQPGDVWSFAGYGEIFATDTPLRALRNGITANAIGGAATWRRDEGLSIRGALQLLDFSDGNLRHDASLRGQLRLHSAPDLTVDGALGFGLTGNSDPGGPYYAPRSALNVTPEIGVQHILRRRYETVWSHRLVVAPGATWESGFGTAFTPSLRYEHRVRPNDTLELAAIGRVSRPVYDGATENVLALALELIWKF
jgi:biofilm PGA synthesis protein PgaA